MSEIVFQPYVGPRYHDAPRRLLIVGESHYDYPSEVLAESTEVVVENWRSRKWRLRYLTTAARIITGKRNTEIDRQIVLDEVAFYNFVQTMMQKGQKPTKQQAQASQGAFKEVLGLCIPTHIIVGSYFAWENMPTEQCKVGQLYLDGKIFKAREYETPKGHALAIPLPHLSRTPAPMWQQAAREFLALDGPLAP